MTTKQNVSEYAKVGENESAIIDFSKMKTYGEAYTGEYVSITDAMRKHLPENPIIVPMVVTNPDEMVEGAKVLIEGGYFRAEVHRVTKQTSKRIKIGESQYRRYRESFYNAGSSIGKANGSIRTDAITPLQLAEAVAATMVAKALSAVRWENADAEKQAKIDAKAAFDASPEGQALIAADKYLEGCELVVRFSEGYLGRRATIMLTYKNEYKYKAEVSQSADYDYTTAGTRSYTVEESEISQWSLSGSVRRIRNAQVAIDKAMEIAEKWDAVAGQIITREQLRHVLAPEEKEPVAQFGATQKVGL